MTETHELNRLVICLLYAACGVMRRVKSPRTACNDRFRRPAPLRLSTERRGCTQTVNWHCILGRRRKPSGASCTTESSGILILGLFVCSNLQGMLDYVGNVSMCYVLFRFGPDRSCCARYLHF